MIFVQTANPVATRNPHLMLPATLKVGTPGQHGFSWSVEAVWFGRQRGASIISHGLVRGHSDNPSLHSNPVLEDFLTAEDLQYRKKFSHVHTRWNGTSLWVEANHQTSLAEHARVIQVLDSLYKSVPANNWAVPAGYDGWWQPKK